MVLIAVVAAAAAWTLLGGLPPTERNNLSNMRTATLGIKGQRFATWIAETEEQCRRGLMFVQSDQMATLPDGTHRAMLFVFDREEPRSFWMHNTVIPLDIAYARSDGTIVKIHTMTPLDTASWKYRSGRPSRYAIEVNANLFARLGIREGDRIELPPGVGGRAP